MIFPAILSGALLAFVLSIDDFVVTSFTNGSGADVPAVDLRRLEARHAAAGQRHGYADLRGRHPDRRSANAVISSRRREETRSVRGADGHDSRHRVRRALADAVPALVLARSTRRARPGRPALTGATTADLAVVGGGFTGLWTALIAKERDPQREVVVLEALERRLGGLRAQRRLLLGEPHPRPEPTASNAFRTRSRRWRSSATATSTRSRPRIARYGIDCGFERTGELNVATAAVAGSTISATASTRRAGSATTSTCSTATRSGPRSPRRPTWPACGTATAARCSIRPGWPGDCGRRACGSACASTRARRSSRSSRQAAGLALRTPHGIGDARARRAGHRRVPVACCSGCGTFVVPVYDYVLMTEPLISRRSWPTIGWRHRQGVGDTANQFHYYRLTAGQPDPVGRLRRGLLQRRPDHSRRSDQRPATAAKLAAHFFETFPQLEDVRFTHSWGGVIDTCSRFCAFFGTAYHGRLSYAAGYTGPGRRRDPLRRRGDARPARRRSAPS